ncbi:unnamed protein product [Linum trigynum]|uniref:Uncharacterized protein n=1 Tax=Linum trigynum TaxID=586398 RepID=A0AAV2E2G4_9ROSI
MSCRILEATVMKLEVACQYMWALIIHQAKLCVVETVCAVVLSAGLGAVSRGEDEETAIALTFTLGRPSGNHGSNGSIRCSQYRISYPVVTYPATALGDHGCVGSAFNDDVAAAVAKDEQECGKDEYRWNLHSAEKGVNLLS